MTTRRRFIQAVGAGALGTMFYGCGGGGGSDGTATASSAQVDVTALARRRSTTATSIPTATGISGRVVVVGGGMGGATVAKFLRLWGGDKVEVTLIERDRTYQSNILSNLVLTSQMNMSQLSFDHGALASRYGIRVVYGEVAAVDPAGHRVALADGSTLAYDRLVLAPGIAFDTISGLERPGGAEIVHAWQAGPHTTLLQKQISAMAAGGVFVMTIPAAPYRCPPGPYERACVVADYLMRRKPGSKVIVLDENAAITAERHTFETAFAGRYKDVIEYHPASTILEIDPATHTLDTNLGRLTASVINPIPAQRAGRIVSDTAGLANVNGRWAGVDVLSYESTALADIHVIGDSNGSSQPKAGHIANAEAKVCADAILRLFNGDQPDPAPATNSACYSPISASTASWLTAVFAYDPASRSMKAVPGASAEAASPTKDSFEEMFLWFHGLMGDTFA